MASGRSARGFTCSASQKREGTWTGPVSVCTHRSRVGRLFPRAPAVIASGGRSASRRAGSLSWATDARARGVFPSVLETSPDAGAFWTETGSRAGPFPPHARPGKKEGNGDGRDHAEADRPSTPRRCSPSGAPVRSCSRWATPTRTPLWPSRRGTRGLQNTPVLSLATWLHCWAWSHWRRRCRSGVQGRKGRCAWRDAPGGVGRRRPARTECWWTSRPAPRAETICRRVLLFLRV